MFLKFYGLREQPFGVTPDPRYLYPSPTHREALASLVYSVESGLGFSALIANPGMGKTTLLFHLMEQLRKNACTAFLFQTQCTSRELLSYLLTDMGIETEETSLVRMHMKLNEALVRLKRNNMRFVMIVDEAQNLKDNVLETIRLLSDFETPDSKLIQIILSGQPQLADKLASPGLVQLRQRIAMICRLNPLTREETEAYIDHRLRLAGYEGGPLFNSEARDLLMEQCEGIPRKINILCFNALSLGCALGRKKIDAEIMGEVIRDMNLESFRGASAASRISVPTVPPPKQEDVSPSAMPPCLPAPSLATREYSPMPSFSALAPPDAGRGQRRGRTAVLASALLVAGAVYFLVSVRMPSAIQLTRWLPSVRRVAAQSLGDRPIQNPAQPRAAIVTPAAAIDTTAALSGQPADFQPSTVMVNVKKGEWLNHICLKHFGECNPGLLNTIRTLNPELTDPNVLSVGQLIRLPKSADIIADGVTSGQSTKNPSVVRSN